MEAVRRFAADGGPWWDLQRLPGPHRGRAAAGRAAEERGLRFLASRPGSGRSTRSVLTARRARPGARVPINHFAGSYACDDETLATAAPSDRVVLRYKDNPNGSADDIAGISNEAGNVVGLMPHPERAPHAAAGLRGRVLVLLRSLLNVATARAAA